MEERNEKERRMEKKKRELKGERNEVFNGQIFRSFQNNVTGKESNPNKFVWISGYCKFQAL